MRIFKHRPSTVLALPVIDFHQRLQVAQSGFKGLAELRFDSSHEDDTEGAEHRGCCIRNAHCDLESHRQEMGQVESNDRYLRQIGEIQTMSDELSDVKEQLRVASPTEGDDPDERSKHGVPRQQDLTQQQPPTESPPQKQHVSPQSSSQPLKQQSRKDPRPQ